MNEWTTKARLAADLEISRRTLDRHLESGEPIETGLGELVELVERAPTAAEYADGLAKQTKSLVCAVKCGENAPNSPEIEPETPSKQPETPPDGVTPDPEQAARDALDGHGSAEETLVWLERIRRGEETRTYATAKGELVTGEYSDMAQLRAAKDAQALRDHIADRDRHYIPREAVANAVVGLCAMLGGRLEALPARLAGRVAASSSIGEIREALTTEIDTIRDELGGEAERHLVDMLGGHDAD
jgi:hypothetical protein